jgi:preprotein translocase subunit SecD
MGKRGSDKLTQEEKEIRKNEDVLFDNLKEAPQILEGVMDVLGDDAKTKSIATQRSNDQKRRAVREDKKLTKLKNAIEGKEVAVPVKRKRGRPRKVVAVAEEGKEQQPKEVPQILEGVMDVSGDDAKTKSIATQRPHDQKRSAVKEGKKVTKLKNAIEGKEVPVPVKRKRGRPRKVVAVAEEGKEQQPPVTKKRGTSKMAKHK